MSDRAKTKRRETQKRKDNAEDYCKYKENEIHKEKYKDRRNTNRRNFIANSKDTHQSQQ